MRSRLTLTGATAIGVGRTSRRDRAGAGCASAAKTASDCQSSGTESSASNFLAERKPPWHTHGAPGVLLSGFQVFGVAGHPLPDCDITHIVYVGQPARQAQSDESQ